MLLPSTYEPLIMEVSDRIAGVKQKVRLASTLISETVTALSVSLCLIVSQFTANPDGSYGAPASGKGISEYPVYLVADNTCAVDPATGDPVYQLITPMAVKNMHTGVIELLSKDQTFAAYLEAAEGTFQLQGDWFANLLKAAGTPVRNLQQYFILAADQPPYSKFSAAQVVEVIPQPAATGGTIDQATLQQMALESAPKPPEPAPATEPATPAT